MLTGFSSMGVCGLSSGRPCPFALRVWQARADRWPPLSIPLQSNTVTGFSSAVDLATASQQSRLALGLSNRRVMKSSAAHMIIKALTLGGLSEPYPPPLSSPVCHSHSQSLVRIVIRYMVLCKKPPLCSIKRAKTFGGFTLGSCILKPLFAYEAYITTILRTSSKTLAHSVAYDNYRCPSVYAIPKPHRVRATTQS